MNAKTPWFLMPCFFTQLTCHHAHYCSFRFEKDTRYYSLCIEKDLFGDWILVAINGRIQTKLGRIRTFPFDNFSSAFNFLCDMIEIRFKRRYHLTSYRIDNVLLTHLIAYRTRSL